MLKKTITYTDYNGVERTEDFYFNLTKAECIELQFSETGGLANHIEAIVKTEDTQKLVPLFKKLVLAAYGEKSADGKRFIKSDELSTAFSQTEAYSELFMLLATNAEEAVAFVNGVLPADLQNAEE
jgi:hypothetical protein